MPERNLGPVSAISGVPFPPELISYTAVENWPLIRSRLHAAHVAAAEKTWCICLYQFTIVEELARVCLDVNREYFQGNAVLSYNDGGSILLITAPRLNSTFAAPRTIAVLPLGTLQYPPIYQQQPQFQQQSFHHLSNQFQPQYQQQYQQPPQQQSQYYPANCEEPPLVEAIILDGPSLKY